MAHKSSAKDQATLLSNSIAAGVSKALNEGPVTKLVESLKDFTKTNKSVLEKLEIIAGGQKSILDLVKASKANDDDSDGADTVDIDVDAVLAATHADPTDPTASSMRGKGDASSSTSASSSASGSSSMAGKSDDATSDDATDATSASDQDAAADPTAIDGSDPSVPPNRIVNKKASEHAKSQSKGGAKGQLAPGDSDGGVSASKGDKDRKGAITVAAATARMVNDLRAALETERGETKKLRNLVKKMEAQIERFSERQERRSLSPEALNLLEKSGVNAFDLMASSTKLTVGQVDEMLAKSGLNLDPVTRMALKNQFLAAGVMEQGIINRRLM